MLKGEGADYLGFYRGVPYLNIFATQMNITDGCIYYPLKVLFTKILQFIFSNITHSCIYEIATGG